MATLLLLLPANLMLAMTVHVAGISSSSRIASGLITAWHQRWYGLTLVLALLGVILPLVRFGLLSATLAAVRFGFRGGWVGMAFRYSELFDVWAMADVLLIGAGIGYGRIVSQVPVRIDAGGWCFVAAAVMTMITRASLERRAVWQRVEDLPAHTGSNAVSCTGCDLLLPPDAEGRRCPRCRARVHRRRPNSLSLCTALLMATFLVTPIAYSYPMSEFWEAGTPHPHSIIDGIMLLFQNGFWYFGVIIFCVSVIFPLTKLFSLTWFLVSIHNGSTRWLREKTRLYRFIDEVGRWSTLDPFAVVIFLPLVQFGQLAHIDVMGASPAFLSTVILSMLSAHVFDPRLMWDAANTQEHSAVLSVQPAAS